jgi:hypothetical protein
MQSRGSSTELCASSAASGLEVNIEEIDDPSSRVAGRRLVIAGGDELRERLDPERQLRRVVIIEKAVAGPGVHLDVVLNACPNGSTPQLSYSKSEGVSVNRPRLPAVIRP